MKAKGSNSRPSRPETTASRPDMGSSGHPRHDGVRAGRYLAPACAVPEGIQPPVGRQGRPEPRASPSAAEVVAAATDPALAAEARPASAVGRRATSSRTPTCLPQGAGGRGPASRLMVGTFMRAPLTDAVPESACAAARRNCTDGVVLASIVEREYRCRRRGPADGQRLPEPAAHRHGPPVLRHRRLRDQPTARASRTPARIFDRDLKIDDPFNTYVHPGLPPGTHMQPRHDGPGSGLPARTRASTCTSGWWTRTAAGITSRRPSTSTSRPASLAVKPRSP
ncbi:MAG: hypothetical protein MZU95_08450 [Desulfomicrobium escambiense]|nr:hypothetical protein [Desulfomicrobium escambiense]